MRQTLIDGTPQPTRVRQGRRGPHPKPVEDLPVRVVKFRAYSDHEKDLALIKAAGYAERDADILRKLVEEKARELRDAGADDSNPQGRLAV